MRGIEMVNRRFLPFSRSLANVLNLLRIRQKESVHSSEISPPSFLTGQVFVDERHQIAFANETLKSNLDAIQWFEDVREIHALQSLKVEWVPLSVVAARITEAHHHADEETDAEDMRSRARELLKWGNSIGATDIHIRKLARYAVVEVRVDGILLASNQELTPEYADRLMRGLYGLCTSGDTTYRESLSQDGTIGGDNLRGTGLINVRIARTPAAPVSDGGQVMAVRLQAGKGRRTRNVEAVKRLKPITGPPGKLDLERVGWTTQQSELLRSFVLSPTGTTWFTGPPGSGKTYAIHDMSAYLARVLPGMRQVFIEQPVELLADWAVQLDISNTLNAEQAGQAFDANARLALRLDTNFLIYGEVRDALVAGAWLSSAEGGMGMMATMHTSNPFEVVSRLRDMDNTRLDFGTICNTAIMSGFVAQRMMPLLCDKCSLPWSTDDERFPGIMTHAVGTWGSNPKEIRKKGKGCEHCTFTGYAGKPWVVAEVVDADEALMGDLVTYGTTIARHRYHARSNADTTMLEKAMELVFSEQVDPFDVIRIVDRIRPRDAILKERELGLKAKESVSEDLR